MTKNTWTVTDMNALPTAGVPWPDKLGGGLVPPVGLVVTGDLVDNGMTEWTQWANWTVLYGLDGTDGLLKMPVWEGRGNHDGGNSSEAQPHFVAAQCLPRVAARARVSKVDVSCSGVSLFGLSLECRYVEYCKSST